MPVPLSRASAIRTPSTSTKQVVAAATQLINGLHDGTMSETAYDTALVSHLRSSSDPTQIAFPATLGWLRRYQHEDGSWGGRIQTAHDRIVSTLAAVVRLAEVPDPWAHDAVERGVSSLWRYAANWSEEAHETIAFELLVPHLLHVAQDLDLTLPYDAFERVSQLQAEKLRKIPPGYLYQKPTTLIHSLEFLGSDLDRDRIGVLRSSNGSYGNSPSATAHVLLSVPDERAERYLRRVMSVSLNGGACNVYPFEIFEKAWVLYNFLAAGISLPSTKPHLQYLSDSIGPNGAGISRDGLIQDSDNTAVTMVVLHNAGYQPDTDLILGYEQDDYFSCFPFERNASISANAHVLHALRNHPNRYKSQIAKLIVYLRSQRLEGCYWQDKWHVSPYYATTQVVIAAQGLTDRLVPGTRSWLLETQRPEGSWGRYVGTSEETAYAIQALLSLPDASDPTVQAAVNRGVAYLSEHFHDTDYPELWIGKGLYTPYAVVRSAILSALHMHRHPNGKGRR
jgi:halimadienyl-diphosphate synthase